MIEMKRLGSELKRQFHCDRHRWQRVVNEKLIFYRKILPERIFSLFWNIVKKIENKIINFPNQLQRIENL